MVSKYVPEPRAIEEDEFVTLPEIAFLARNTEGEPLKRGTVERWRIRIPKSQEKAFLEPDDYIGSTPIWRLPRVLAWFDANNRPYDVKAWRKTRNAGGFRRRGDR